ncbi:MAG: hypothetical protein AAFV95_18680 [Bacteroidota bacterium]
MHLTQPLRYLFFSLIGLSLTHFFACGGDTTDSAGTQTEPTEVVSTPNLTEAQLDAMVIQSLREDLTPEQRIAQRTAYDQLNDHDVVIYNRILRKYKFQERVIYRLDDGGDTTGMAAKFMNREKMADEMHKKSMILFKRPYFRLDKDQKQEVVLRYNENIRPIE